MHAGTNQLGLSHSLIRPGLTPTSEAQRQLIKECLTEVLDAQLKPIREEIRTLQNTVEQLRSELLPATSSFVSGNGSPTMLSGSIKNSNHESPLVTPRYDPRSPADEKKFKDYCREVARLCLDVQLSWTNQNPSASK